MRIRAFLRLSPHVTPLSAMDAKIFRNSGRALLGVFVVTVVAVLFPLNLGAAAIHLDC